MTKVAAVQMASGPNVHANLLEAGKLIATAAGNGARLVVLPENFALMPMQDVDQLAACEPPGSGPIQDFLAATARRHGIWLVGGTVPLACERVDRLLETCIVFDDEGQQVARYSKMHLFDVVLQEARESYHESALISAGNEAVVVPSPLGVLGLSVGYDLRFPELFRWLVEQGMEIAVVPSTFTRITGRAHWEPLLRARAIENLCMVIGAAQGGYHAGPSPIKSSM